MSRSSEAYQIECEQENLSGMDLFEAWNYKQQLNNRGITDEYFYTNIGRVRFGKNHQPAKHESGINPSNSGSEETFAIPF
jgi:hypothetical protein